VAKRIGVGEFGNRYVLPPPVTAALDYVFAERSGAVIYVKPDYEMLQGRCRRRPRSLRRSRALAGRVRLNSLLTCSMATRNSEPVDDLLDALVWMRRKAKRHEAVDDLIDALVKMRRKAKKKSGKRERQAKKSNAKKRRMSKG